jgi:hypothetical protein
MDWTGVVEATRTDAPAKKSALTKDRRANFKRGHPHVFGSVSVRIAAMGGLRHPFASQLVLLRIEDRIVFQGVLIRAEEELTYDLADLAIFDPRASIHGLGISGDQACRQ